MSYADVVPFRRSYLGLGAASSPPNFGARSFVLPKGHPILTDPMVMESSCGACAQVVHASGAKSPPGTWSMANPPRAGVRYTPSPNCAVDCGQYEGLGDWSDFDTSNLARQVADQITGPVYESFKAQFQADLPNIVAEIRPYLRQEVRDAVPTDILDAVTNDAIAKAKMGGMIVIAATSILTVLGVWALLEAR